MLHYYGERFPTVEVNNTFYRLPNEATLLGWLSQVPEDFTFVLKASNRITHDKRLKEVEDSVQYLLRTSAALGAKLGPFLVQIPANFTKDLRTVQRFLGSLPRRA